MGISDRIFALPPSDAARVESRLAALPVRVRSLVEQAGTALAGANTRDAKPLLTAALAAIPTQPDALRLYGLLLTRTGDFQGAAVFFEKALRASPDDVMGYWQYARALEQMGKVEAALALRRRATVHLSESPAAWADLGEHLFRHRSVETAVAPLERAVKLAPDFAPALFKLGTTYVACGRVDDGVTMIRGALEREPGFGAAWLGLVDVKTVALTQQELSRMRALLTESSGIDAGERTAIEFALGAACERVGLYAEAWQRLVHANNRRKRELRPWPAGHFVERELRAEEVFARPRATLSTSTLGQHVIFIVGMPRSGTTLVEQILASHPDVRGAGELPALPQVLTEESSRSKCLYPDWVPYASVGDWERLGLRYLELTEAFRREHPFSTDKLPVNWRAIGAIRAMLPGARIVVCRRDPLENCWSCFKQYFGQGWEFTYDIGDLVTFWKEFDRAVSRWLRDDPRRVHEQGYEPLTEAPEREIRALLAFCGLPYDDACLNFHQSRNIVRTLSSAQVRLPMYKHRSVAARYGALLNPLRSALGFAAIM